MARMLIAAVLGAVMCLALADDELHTLKYDAELMKAEVPKKPHFIKFYAPWCGHCKKLAPAWEELADKYNTKGNKKEVVIAEVDCTVETALCSEQGVSGYPTLQYYKDDPTNASKYKGGRQLEAFDTYLRGMLDGPKEEEEEEKVETVDVPEEQDGLVELVGGAFDKYVAKGSSFIKFYAPWCGHCKRLAPTWQELAKEYESQDSVNIGKIDCTQFGDVCKKFEVRGYPTLLFFKDGKKLDKYNGGRELDALKEYVEKSRGASADTVKTEEKIPDKKEDKPEGADSDVLILETDNFDEGIAKGTTLIKFYAPWCGHCKRLAPTWDELAKKFKDNNDINIAKIDCTTNRDICSTHKVNGFPTLILFRNGQRVADHNGGRDLNTLSTFIMDNLPHDEL